MVNKLTVFYDVNLCLNNKSVVVVFYLDFQMKIYSTKQQLSKIFSSKNLDKKLTNWSKPEKIKEYVTGKSILVVFDDMINSKALSTLATLFTVDGRHMNMSLMFLTQRMFVNNEYFRQISQNCDYFVVFKNPRNSSEIRMLAQQITPGSLHLINIYIEATKDPFSFLFINLTQECEPEVKYLSQLFSKDHSVKAFVEST